MLPTKTSNKFPNQAGPVLAFRRAFPPNEPMTFMAFDISARHSSVPAVLEAHSAGQLRWS
jgi:hypothetical protein